MQFVSSLSTYYFAFISWHFQDISCVLNLEGIFPILHPFRVGCVAGRMMIPDGDVHLNPPDL